MTVLSTQSGNKIRFQKFLFNKYDIITSIIFKMWLLLNSFLCVLLCCFHFIYFLMFLVASTSWSPESLSRPVMGSPYINVFSA